MGLLMRPAEFMIILLQCDVLDQCEVILGVFLNTFMIITLIGSLSLNLVKKSYVIASLFAELLKSSYEMKFISIMFLLEFHFRVIIIVVARSRDKFICIRT